MFCFFSSKGGSGCSVTAAVTAKMAAERSPTLLVDLHGDLTTILGVPSDADGLAGWFRTDAASPDLLHRLEVPLGDGLSLLPRGGCRSVTTPDRYRLLGQLLSMDRRQVVVDVGTSAIPAVAIVAQATTSVLVTRACYLALRAAGCGPTPDQVVLVREPGRALRAKDIEAAVGAPVGATVDWDPAVARAVDAGLLLARRPKSCEPLRALL